MSVKSLLFAAALCWAALSHGQGQSGFQSFFGMESTRWNGVTEVTEFYDVPLTNYVLRIAGDTVVDGKAFNKIECFAIYLLRDSKGKDSSHDFCLREDASTGKLWCRFLDEDNDFHIVDMSLSIGDTIALRDFVDNNGSLEYVVQDTMTLDDHYTIVLRSTVFGRTITFVEGVGCSNLLDYMRTDITGSQLVCCHKDDELVYHNSVENWPDEYCVVRGLGIDEYEDNANVAVWPNPCDDWLQIGSDDFVKSVSLYDMAGRMIMEHINVVNNRISMNNVPRGTYLLHIDLIDSKLQRKVIKK